MKITVIGPGAIGLVLAGSLDSKNQVSVLAKPEAYEKLKQNGLWIKERNKKRKINAKIITEIDDSEIVIIAVKGYDLDTAVNLLHNFKGKVIICQNGLKMLNLNLEHSNDFYAIVTSMGAISTNNGVTEFKGTGRTVLGSLNNVKKKRDEILNIFSKNYFEISHTNNIEKSIWLKAVVNSAINPIASLYNLKNGDLKKEQYWYLVRELLAESTEIARSNGIDFNNEPIKLAEEIIQKTADNYCSMLQDIKKGKKTEINEINGILHLMGQKQNVKTTLNLEYLKKINTLINS